jgi:hypothetical protein
MANKFPAGRNRHGTIDNIGRTFVPAIRVGSVPPRRFHFASRAVRAREAADHQWTKDSIGRPLDQPFHIIKETIVRPNEAAIRWRVR